MSNLVNINTFAFNLGKAKRMTLAASLPFHNAYVKADDAGKAQLRREWMLGYVAGLLNVTPKKSESILSEGKGKDSNNTHEQMKAIDSASTNFREHVVRPEGTANQTKKVRVPAALRSAIKALLDEGYTAEQIKACL